MNWIHTPLKKLSVFWERISFHSSHCLGIHDPPGSAFQVSKCKDDRHVLPYSPRTLLPSFFFFLRWSCLFLFKLSALFTLCVFLIKHPSPSYLPLLASTPAPFCQMKIKEVSSLLQKWTFPKSPCSGFLSQTSLPELRETNSFCFATGTQIDLHN